jgi:GR25 family glycosyltransferase involved in LPS biosynthesis
MISFKKFVINLKRRPDRLAEFKLRFGSFSEDVEVFCAVDGVKYVRDGIFSTFEKNLLKFSRFGRVREAEFGCWLSHYRLWETALSIEEDAIVIFEDDAFPSLDFKDKFNEIIGNVTPDMNVVFFGGRFKPNFKPMDMNPWVKKGIFYYVREGSRYFGRDMDRTFHGYILTKRGARGLIDRLNREIEMGTTIWPVDNWVSNGRIESGALDYFPHIAHSPSNYMSDIQRR